MTIYGQTLAVFKRGNNECSRNGVKTKLHKIKIVVFFYLRVCSRKKDPALLLLFFSLS